jgi:hypothetical protein
MAGKLPPKRLSVRRVFGVPLILAVASLIGLISALVGDDVWDVLSWVTLGAMVVVMGWYWLRRTQ